MQISVKTATFNLLRQLGMIWIVGNPGSTEETFLQDLPEDFTYIQALHEGSAVAIADGLAQGLRQPVLVNVHTGVGLGHSMGAILTAYQNKTPLIVTSGQQTRDMLLFEPALTNVNAVTMPLPWVKWSYEPARPEDVPGAFMRAYAMAVQPPAGPVYLSVPMDDWDKMVTDCSYLRTVSHRVAPDPVRLADFAQRIDQSKNPVLIYGADIARSDAWDAGVHLAEQLQAPVWSTPFNERAIFPSNHGLYAGILPAAIAPLADCLQGHDLAIVVGAPVFRYYPYVAGHFLPEGTSLLQITDDPDAAAKAPVGDSLLGDSLLFLEQIMPLITPRSPLVRLHHHDQGATRSASEKFLSAEAVFSILKPLCPDEVILLEESPSNAPALRQIFLVDQPDSFYTFASGQLGWNMPAAIGLALHEQISGRHRPVIVFVGDGAFNYAPQCIYTGVRHHTHVIFVVLQNHEYAILKEFAIEEKLKNIPGLDLPGIAIADIGTAYGAHASVALTTMELEAAFREALSYQGVSVLQVPISSELHPLID
ncbi:benzoylformate decarboxylase [Acidithiobacillus albertensis]|uniref:benzoylformate decarboxylase n=1 Tax=Acidithiobacillus albertensis TaxID=119978 RepID=UPI00094B2829|nr:benzoylformate decarboxylase [Acidithiobacillus albertensis]